MDALHVLDVGLDRARDLDILEWALSNGRTCVTLDHDFHAHLARASRRGPSVIRIRADGFPTEMQAQVIAETIAQCAEQLKSGAAVSTDGRNVRTRKLPLG